MTTTLRATKDYGVFELHEFNRDVEQITRLEESMKLYGWIDAYPMYVVRNGDKKLKVKDGHHRLEVAKKLGIPAKFVVCQDSISIHELQKTTRPWSPSDYLTSYVRYGLPEYIAVKEYVDETGIPLGLAISLLAGESAGSANRMLSFKDGKYKLGNQLHADQVKAIVLHMKKCGIDFSTNSFFIQALSKALWVEGFSVSRFKDKISAHSAYFERQPNVQAYLDAIEAIYNRQSKDRMPVAFLAVEKSKERKTTFGKGLGA